MWLESLEIIKIMLKKISNAHSFWNLVCCLNIWTLGSRRQALESFETQFRKNILIKFIPLMFGIEYTMEYSGKSENEKKKSETGFSKLNKFYNPIG